MEARKTIKKTKSNFVKIRVTEGEKNQLSNWSKSSNMTLTNYVRKKLF